MQGQRLHLDNVRVTLFLCAKCSNELTPDLTALPAVPELPADFNREKGQDRAPSTVPRGYYAIEPDPWGAPFVQQQGREVSAGPRNTVVIDPDDAPLLQPLPGHANSLGCCGPIGRHGRNRACPCGTAVATLVADCIGPYELHLDPLRVFPLD